MSKRAGELSPHDCERCDCQEFQWNGMNCTLKSDPPSTCVCGHRVSQHRFRRSEAVAR